MEVKSGAGERLQKLLKNKKNVQLIFIAGIAGIALIFLSNFFTSDRSDSIPKQESITVQQYVEELETKLYTMVTSIGGVGQAQIMITLENGIEYVYQNAERTDTNLAENSGGTTQKDTRQKDIVIVDGPNGREALIRKMIEPTIKGVVVVCEGGDNILIKERVTEAVSTALGISATRICVIK
ncbi:MAG: hypothetical protein FWH14_08955 [Oscillospiraceae bacterium]|nr:hypothetical protein [Oscillospiraceae bacterium]